MTSGWHLAQINVGTLAEAPDHPQIRPFMDNLARINGIAEASPGFVWRLKDDSSGGAMDIHMTDDPLFQVNMSVWETVEALRHFVYRTDHRGFLADRKLYFAEADYPFLALWWVPAGHAPSVDEGLARLWMLERQGPTSRAFTLARLFPAPGGAG